ncbi:CopG family ribbon-helix-helix protein [Rhizobium sp. LjRoot254]|uniref:CopG family ribbon-helix-helix protein n=1 Tax=Rhizobium sp. LjRoot254 TaxID=3342297 RepID=UPI003ED07213
MASKAEMHSVSIPSGLKASLERLAESRNVNEAELVSEALTRYIDEEMDYSGAIDEALKESEEGVFVSGDKVIEWMKSWGTENELPMLEPDIILAKRS